MSSKSITSELIVVTGANGFLGFHIVQQLVDAGHATRAVVRSEKSAERLRTVLHKAVEDGLLTFAYVSDITGSDSVYDEAFAQSTAIIHTASPIFSLGQKSDNADKDFLQPAINGALNAIKAASRQSTVQRFVLTSSVAARTPWDRSSGPFLDRNEVYPINRQEVLKLTDGAAIYRASKPLSEQAVWDYVKEQKPSFQVTTLLPALFGGPTADPEADLNTGSNSIYVAWATSPLNFLKAGASITAADVKEVAASHINVALTPSKDTTLNGQSYFVVQRTIRIVEVVQAAAAAVPEWAEKWDDNTKALIKEIAGREPSEQEKGLYAPSQESDAKVLGIAPMRDATEVLKELFRAVDAQSKSKTA